MKKQIPIMRTFIQAALLLIATTVASTASAETIAYGDFNDDGLDDMAAITSPITITIGLANIDGSYTGSAVLSAPKNRTFADVSVRDDNGDGFLDVIASSWAGGWIYTFKWLGNGDGTFGSIKTDKWAWPPKGRQHGFF